MTQVHETPEIYCPACGYDLRSIPSNRCPECGMEIDRSRLGESVIPWVHRKKIGRSRAFWKTVILVTFQVKRLEGHLHASVSLVGALQFRRMVVLHALVPFGLFFSYLYYQRLTRASHAGFVMSSDMPGSVVQMMGLIMGWLCLAMFFFSMTGVATFFFHPKRLSIAQQNRAIAIGYYAGAPVTFLAAAFALAWATFAGVKALSDAQVHVMVVGCAFILGCAPLLVHMVTLIRTPVVLLRASTFCDAGRQLALGVFLPFAWCILATVMLWLIPTACATLALMAMSFRQ